MKAPVLAILSGVLLLASSPAPNIARSLTGQPGDMSGLLKQCICKGTSKLITEYTYQLEMSKHRKNRRGEIEKFSEVYEVYVPPLKKDRLTQQIMVTTSRDGKPVSAKDLEKERLRAGEKLEKAEKEAQGQQTESPSFLAWCSGNSPIGTYFTFVIAAGAMERKLRFTPLSILRSCTFDSPRYEDLNGRRMIALTFKPREGFEYAAEDRYLSKLMGTIWIDAEEKIAARIEAWPVSGDSLEGSIKAHKALGKGAVITYEQVRLPEGVWMPKRIELNTNSYSHLFGRYYYDNTCVFTDYKRFTTSVEEVATGQAEKKP